MKESIKFASSVFGLALLFFLLEYWLIPTAYQGERLMIVWMYIFNIVIGIILFPLCFAMVSKLKVISRFKLVLIYFCLVIFITNILPFFSGNVFYTVKLISTLFDNKNYKADTFFELINPVLSFVIAWLLFQKSRLWKTSDEII